MPKRKQKQEWWEGGLFEELYKNKVDTLDEYLKGEADESSLGNDTERKRELEERNVTEMDTKGDYTTRRSTMANGDKYPIDSDRREFQSSMDTNRQQYGLSKGETTQNGSISGSNRIYEREEKSNISANNKRLNEPIQLEFDFTTELSRDVSLNLDNQWLRQGDEIHNERWDTLPTNSKQNSRASNTSSLYEQTSQREDKDDGILANAGESRNSVLHRIQDSKDLYDDRHKISTKWNDLEGTSSSGSIQGELGEQPSSETNQSSGRFRQNQSSNAIHSDEITKDEYHQNRQRAGGIFSQIEQNSDGIINDLQPIRRETSRKIQQDGSFQTRRSRENNNNQRNIRNSTIKLTSTYKNEDFIYQDEILIKGKKDRFYKNYEAVKLTKELTKIKNIAINNNNFFTITKEEQTIISQFTGWGGVSEAFDENNQNFKKENALLKNLLTEEEYKEAKETITNAYFTPQILVNTIHKALNEMGINSDNNKKRVLEPSAGSGAFLKPNPNFEYLTIEKNHLSSDMLSLLFPNQKHYAMGYEDDLANQNITKFDAIIGNPPFGEIAIIDKNRALKEDIPRMSLHNFFAAKSASHMLKDDGIMAFVISTKFLDSKTDITRRYIDNYATFLGAVRLPENTFDSTHSSTDIVFFKKGKDLNLNNNWLNVENFKESKEVINNYFLENPNNILGNLEIQIRSHGEELVCTKNSNLNLENELNRFVETLPKNIYKFHKNETKINDEIYLDEIIDANYYKDLKQNNYFIFNNEIYIKKGEINNANGILATKPELKPAQQERVKNFINLRDAHKELIELEKTDISDDDNQLIQAREKLNNFLDIYHKKCGFLHNSSRKSGIDQDVDYAKIASLEKNYQKAISPELALKNGVTPRKESCEKANILIHRVIKPKSEIKFDNEFDGLIASINKYGKPNIEYIAKTLNKTSNDVTNSLISENQIFLDPIKLSQGEKEFVLSAKYLSGDVREKLKIAKDIAKTFPEINKNIESLKEVIPTDLKPSEIDAPMGASWIPLKYYNDFFESEFGISQEFWHLSRSNLTGEWKFEGQTHPMTIYNERRLSFERFSPYNICTNALQNSSIVIKKETGNQLRDVDGNLRFDKNGNPMMEKVVDVEKTQKVNSLIQSVREKFDNWIWKDYERRTDLCEIYNNTFNCYAHKHYDGSDLKLDSLNSNINLRKHQKDAIFRAINEQNCLFDHEVGAGKTLTAICSVMKQKELGITNKALIAVPNHLVNQWSDEFYNAYPNANLLISDEKSVSPQNREEFFGKIMNGEYDAIIISHSQLEKIPVPPEVEQNVVRRQIEELRESIDFAEKNDENIRPASIKQMQKRLNSLEERLKEKLDKDNKSKALNFSDLGIDYLVVDESHMYKNLPFSTHLKVKGLGNQAGSKKALSMYCFTEYLNNNDKKILFLTGTPISNSLTELYNINKYLMPSDLEKKGIGSFDAWASNFAKIENVPELNATAQNFKIVSRFTALNNLPEVCGAYGEIADIVTNSDIKKHYTHYVPEVNIIKSVSPISKEQRFYIGVQDKDGNYNEGSIIARMEKLGSGSFDPKIDNHLKCTSDAKKAGIDFRLIDPNAPDFEKSKMNNCVKNIVEEYHNWDKEKGTQLVFLDIGTPRQTNQLSTNLNIDTENNKQEKDFININEIIEDDVDFDQEEDRDSDENSFFLYGDLYKKLVKAGIPREEIAFIHDTGGSNAKKQELFQKVNSGEIRVLIGSTAKMGAGTNVQERVTAIHHFDVPWRPSDFIQRNGRVIRQGNVLFQKDPDNFKIKEFRYVTENTYDAVSWQIIETKSNSLVNFRKGLVDGRTLSGFEEEAASAAEMKAAATGNPLIIDQVKLKSALDKEEILYKNFLNDIINAKDTIEANNKKIDYLKKDIINLQLAQNTLNNNQNENFQCIMLSPYGSKYSTEYERKFDIPKDRNDDFIKLEQESMNNIFLENFKNISVYERNIMEIMRYKGFTIYGGWSDNPKEISFTIQDRTNGKITNFYPENLHYKIDDNNLFTQVSFNGFIRRLNNYLNQENLLKEENKNKETIKSLEKNTIDLKAYLDENETYKKQNILNLLRDENKIIINELAKSSKNPAYKSSFKSKFLESQNLKNNRIINNENKQEKNKEIL